MADSEIPNEYREEFLEAKSEIQVEHIEEDLEADRVISLYFVNHYLRTGDAAPSPVGATHWWQPLLGQGSPLIDALVQQYWDHGPFSQIKKWVSQSIAKPSDSLNLVELGCGVGGLYQTLKPSLGSYLGVDSSFSSIALARRINLGVPPGGSIRIPEDLLRGSTFREIPLQRVSDQEPFGKADFIVGDLDSPCLQTEAWDFTVALNTLDMLDEPSSLPELQRKLLKPQGRAIQSCPYVWHEVVAKKLRARLPNTIRESSAAAEWLYQQAGFQITEKVDHLPWLFFKQVRQLEVYSVHLFQATKTDLMVSPLDLGLKNGSK